MDKAVLFIIAAIILVAGVAVPPAFADGHKWSTADTYRQAAVTALLLADWQQTRYVAKHPDLFREVGFARPFIGSHPSVGSVNTYFAVGIVTHAAISYMLPPKWRAAWQYLEIGIEVGTVRRNYIGFRHGF